MSITGFAISMGGSKTVGEKPESDLTFDFKLNWALSSNGSGSGAYFSIFFQHDDGGGFANYDLWNSSGTVTWVLKNKTDTTTFTDLGVASSYKVNNEHSLICRLASNTYGSADDEYELTINFTAAQINAWDSAGSVTVSFYIRTGTSDFWRTNGHWQTAFEILPEGAECFLGPTKVKTDQGLIAFNQLTKYNTIANQKIKKVVKMYNSDDNLIFIKKHAFGKNIPNKNTYIGRNHGIYIDGKLVRARNLINKKNVQQHVRHTNDIIYNVLLEKYSIMYINNMPCETLNENDPSVLKYIK